MVASYDRACTNAEHIVLSVQSYDAAWWPGRRQEAVSRLWIPYKRI
jgi:hypothetical protein